MKIAYLISVYAGDKKEYFKKAIESIIDQKCNEDFTIRIYLGIDGGLDSNIWDFIREYKNHFFKIIKSDKSIGLAGIMNRIIKQLQNEDYLFRMDADDICLLNRTSLQLEHLQMNPKCLAVGASMHEINEVGEIIGHKKAITKEKIQKIAYYRNPFNHPTMALRGDFFKLVGEYNNTLNKSQDYELWLRALSMGYKLENIEQPVLYFRISKDFYAKRTLLENSINELLISWNYIKNTNKYQYLVYVLLKFITRILPKSFSQLAYKIIRK